MSQGGKRESPAVKRQDVVLSSKVECPVPLEAEPIYVMGRILVSVICTLMRLSSTRRIQFCAGSKAYGNTCRIPLSHDVKECSCVQPNRNCPPRGRGMGFQSLNLGARP